MTAHPTVAAMSSKDRSSVDKALLLIAVLRQSERSALGVSELARRAGMSKSTTHRLLSMLVRNGVVTKRDTVYALIEIALPPGPTHDLQMTARLRDDFTPYLTDLFFHTREIVHLAVLDSTDVVYLNKIYGHQHPPTPSLIGGRVPAHCTSVGKVLLAYAPDVRASLSSIDLQQVTPHTIVDPNNLERHLDETARRGVAYDRDEGTAGYSCVAAPVRVKGRVVAAISVSSRSRDFAPSRVEPTLRRVCAAASRELTSRWS